MRKPFQVFSLSFIQFGSEVGEAISIHQLEKKSWNVVIREVQFLFGNTCLVILIFIDEINEWILKGEVQWYILW